MAPPRLVTLAMAAAALAAVISGLPSASAQAGPTVLLAPIDGQITPVVADHIADAVEEAESGDHRALVVTIDTPGGLDVSMRDIVQSFLNAKVPIVTYVSPEGARAASAGTFIAMAAPVAAMAPATSIGAATPVDLGGGEITDKVINDAAAFAISVAERRERDVEFAEAAVREGTSITASEAVERGVVDLVAQDLDELLAAVDGLDAGLTGNDVEIDTEGAAVERFELGVLRSVLGRIADPNLSFIFLSLGTLAVIYEAANPGLGLSGIVGAILLILAFFALSVLPVNAAGIALLVLAIGLFVAELFVSGLGVLAAGGAIALVLSGIFLFDGTLAVSPLVIVPSALVLLLGSIVAGRAIVGTHRRPLASGAETMVGRVVDITPIDDARGRTFVDGAWWEVRTDGRPVTGRMRVVEVRGVYLFAEPEEEAE